MAVTVVPDLTAGNAVAWALMALALAAVAVSCLGTLVMPDPPRRLHYAAPASFIAPVALAAAAFVQDGVNLGSIKFAVAAALLAYAAPLATHATARSARIRAADGWRLRPEEEDAET